MTDWGKLTTIDLRTLKVTARGVYLKCAHGEPRSTPPCPERYSGGHPDGAPVWEVVVIGRVTGNDVEGVWEAWQCRACGNTWLRRPVSLHPLQVKRVRFAIHRAGWTDELKDILDRCLPEDTIGFFDRHGMDYRSRVWSNADAGRGTLEAEPEPGPAPEPKPKPKPARRTRASSIKTVQ